MRANVRVWQACGRQCMHAGMSVYCVHAGGSQGRQAYAHGDVCGVTWYREASAMS